MNVKILNIVKPIAESAAKNIDKIATGLGAALVAFASFKVGNERGKTKGEKEGYSKASKNYEKKYQEQEERFENKVHDIEDRIK